MTTYSDYADAMELGGRLYPLHETGADLTYYPDSKECAVCAHGAMVAGLEPARFADELGFLRDRVDDDGDDGGPESADTLPLAGDHPLVLNTLVSCPRYRARLHPCIKSEDYYANSSVVRLAHAEWGTVDSMIAHLFDDHLWSIAQVAAWLRSLDGPANGEVQ